MLFAFNTACFAENQISDDLRLNDFNQDFLFTTQPPTTTRPVIKPKTCNELSGFITMKNRLQSSINAYKLALQNHYDEYRRNLNAQLDQYCLALNY